jgi:hypothetical protein
MRLALITLLLLAPQAQAAVPDSRPVTQEQFKQLVKIFKNVVNRIDTLEKDVKDLQSRPSGGAPKKEDVIDLGASDSKIQSAPVEAASTRVGTHGQSLAMPNFKVYFDLDLINRPGTDSPFTFTNYHTFLFFEIIPTSDLQFSFDIGGFGSPNYYELDYQITSRLQMRFGKIWIPFDDLSPHNIFGGRVNVSRLAQSGQAAFLPDLWAELGVGLKYQLLETRNISMEAWLYIVNGFKDGGTDPIKLGNNYPSFGNSGVTVLDNNRDKAVGGRIHTLLGRKWGFGFSFYSGRWNAETSQTAQRLNIVGIDSQLRLKSTEFRVGLASMTAGLPEEVYNAAGDPKNFNRGAYYVEAGQKLGHDQQWKIVGRFGYVQPDNRVITFGDQQIVGGTLLWKPGLVEFSIESSRDLLKRDDKLSYSYSAARVIMAF